MATRLFGAFLFRECNSVSIIWKPLIAESDFPDEGKYAAKAGGWHVLVARAEEGLFAVNDRCTHQASQLSGGRVRRGFVMCPLHGARFDVTNGKCAGGAYADLRTFEVKVEDGMILIAVPDTPPGMDEIPISV